MYILCNFTIYIQILKTNSPLIMRQIHSSYASITARVNIELLEVTGLPYFHHTIVSPCHQVLPIAAQEDGLQEKKTKPKHTVSFYGNGSILHKFNQLISISFALLILNLKKKAPTPLSPQSKNKLTNFGSPNLIKTIVRF